MTRLLDVVTRDTLTTVITLQLLLGLLSSVWISEPGVALALFGIVAVVSGTQDLISIFLVFNGASIVLDVLRLAIADDIPAFGLLVIVQLCGMAAKAYACYLCYDMYGLGGGTAGNGGDGHTGSEYQPAAAGPRHDPFYEPARPPPANPNLYTAGQAQPYAPPPAHSPTEPAHDPQM